MELVSCHPYGVYNFEVAPRILENLCTRAEIDELSNCVFCQCTNILHFSATVPLLHLNTLCTLFSPYVLLTNKILDTVQALWLKKTHCFLGLVLLPASGGMRKGENPL